MRVKPTELVATVLLAAVLGMAAGPAAAATDSASANPEELRAQWAAKRHWLSLRAGYAKSAIDDAANGSFGAGVGYSRMLSKWKFYKWTLFKQFSLGGYGSAAELEAPLTLELVRHFRWSSPYVHPYFGIGGGAFYRKLYRSGDDFARTRPGKYIVFGVNSPVDGNRVLGIDARLVKVDALNDGVNPVFGLGDDNATHWSVKVNYALTY